MCVRSCLCADLAGPLARLLVERLGSCQNGLIDWLVGGHQQQLGLIVILTISKLIFIIYLPLLNCLLILRLGQPGSGGRRGWGGGGIVGGVGKKRRKEEGGREEKARNSRWKGSVKFTMTSTKW